MGLIESLKSKFGSVILVNEGCIRGCVVTCVLLYKKIYLLRISDSFYILHKQFELSLCIYILGIVMQSPYRQYSLLPDNGITNSVTCLNTHHQHTGKFYDIGYDKRMKVHERMQ